MLKKYRKNIIHVTPFKKLLLCFVIFLTLFVFPPSPAYAFSSELEELLGVTVGDLPKTVIGLFDLLVNYETLEEFGAPEERISFGERLCNPAKAVFEDISIDQPQQSIVRFGYNYDSVRYMKLFYNITAMSVEHFPKCMTGFFGDAASGVCGILAGTRPAACRMLGPLGHLFGYRAYNPFNGGLLGIVSILGRATQERPPLDPVYFAQDTLQRVPFAGKALAQYTGPFGGGIINNVLEVWKVARGLAFAFMSVIMLIVGIMIATRRKISAQASVTLQYAIPRVVISMILIAFSYPIGATITTIAWQLAKYAPYFVWNTLKPYVFAGWSDGFLVQASLAAPILATVAATVLVLILLNLALMMIPLLGWSIMIFLWLSVLGILAFFFIKALIIYIKMVIMVITAPFTFAMYAIPGNDDKLSMWFKKMISLGLGLVALAGTFAVSGLVGLIFFNSITNVDLTGDTNMDKVITALVRLLLGGVAYLGPLCIGIWYAIKMPERVEVAIMGKDASKKAQKKVG